MNHEKSIKRLKRPYGVNGTMVVNPQDYTTTFAHIQDVMGRIDSVQTVLQRKRFMEKETFPKIVRNGYLYVTKLCGNELPSKTWGELFGEQITNVGDLNVNLRELIAYSGRQELQLRVALNDVVKKAKGNMQKHKEITSALPKYDASHEDATNSLANFDPDDPEKFDALSAELEAEHELFRQLEETALLKNVLQGDEKKIGFYRSHIMFHAGLLYAAKQLAIHTYGVCETLEHVKHSYDVIKPLGEAIDAVFTGVGSLQGQTRDLQELYKSTYDKVAQIPTHMEQDIFSQRGQIDGLVSRMLGNVQNSLEDEKTT